MARVMGSKQQPILGDLDRIGNEADPNDLPDVAVADPVGGAGEAHRA